MSASARVCEASRARSKRFSSSAASGSTGAIWSTTSRRPPGRVTRTSSAIASSGRAMWCSVRSAPARSNDAYSNGSFVASPSTNETFGNRSARARACSSSSGTRSTPTTSRTCGASANASAPEPVPESSARSFPESGTKRTMSFSSEAARASCSSPTRSAVFANRFRVASCIVERLLLRDDRTRRAFFLDLREQPPDLRPRRQPELVPAQERLVRIAHPRLQHRVRKLLRVDERERLERPRLGRAAEAEDRPRRVVRRPLRPEQAAPVPAELVRDGQPAQAVAEDRNQPVFGRVDAVEPVVDPPAERLEQAQIVEPTVAVGGQPPQLADDPLARRVRRERRVLPDEPLCLVLEPEAELVLEPHRAQQPERIVHEDALTDGAQQLLVQIAQAAEGVDRLPARERAGDRVDREIARRQVVLDRLGERREIHCPPVRERDPPGSVALGERERSAARAPRVCPRGAIGGAAGDVEVHELPPEQLVADGTADDPRLLAGQHVLGGVKHPGRHALPGAAT